MTKASMLSRPGKVKQKDFKPKNNLPRLDDYSVDLPQSYWDKWNKLTFSEANYSIYIYIVTIKLQRKAKIDFAV